MKIFIERPVATAMVFIAVLVLGVYSFLNTPIELAPQADFPQVSISTSWPGMPPEIIQTQITAPLEEMALTVKGVRKITSSSSIGSSDITVEFDPKANMEFANLALREEIARLRSSLPFGVRPLVQPFVPKDFQVQAFLSYTISGNYTLQKLRELVKDKIEFGIGSVKGVVRVEVSGGADLELRISLDKKMLKSYDLHPFQVSSALDQRLRTYPASRVKKGSQEFIFKVKDVINGIRELGETIISHSGEHPIKLKDLAEISPSYTEIYALNRINGQPTIRLSILKEKGMNTLKVAREAKKMLEKIKHELPPDLIFKVDSDESEVILKKLKDLILLAAVITAIVFIMIFVVLRRFKPSLLILSSIAFSVVITFNLIYVFGISMNMLTLGALALGFGMFVDNSIVVFENILRLRQKGLPPLQASLQAPREVLVAVLASTLTTICVFFSFAYFQGRLKIYYLPLAVVISSALAASLLVSFSLIPALSPGLIKELRKVKGEKYSRIFENFLGFILRHPAEVICLVAAIFYGCYRWFRAEVASGEFFSWYPRQNLIVSIGMPPGAEIEKTDEVIRKFEQKVLETNYEKEMNSTIAAQRAYIIIAFPPEIENSFRPYLLKEELTRLATQLAGIDVGIYGFEPQGYFSSLGTGTYYDSSIKFFGYNLRKLREIASELELTLRRNPRIKDVKTVSSRLGWYRADSFEYILKLEKKALVKYNINPDYLYAHIQALLSGTFGRPLRMAIDGKEMNLSLKFHEADEMNLKGLQDYLIKTRGGEYLRLGEVAALEERPIAGSIERENQQFQQTVMWEFRGPYKAAEKYKKAVFSSLKLPQGFSATLEETWKITEEEKAQFKFAILFSLVFVFMILAALYESFIHPFFIMLAVPLELIGVFLAFIISGYPFDSSAYVGVILLAGIVVNNAILLVDNINLKRKQDFPLFEAVLMGTRERVRPIFMTASTTVFGILPMLLLKAEAGRREIWATLALCTAGGLVSSTIFILVIIPIFYFYGERIRFWASIKIQELRLFKEKL